MKNKRRFSKTTYLPRVQQSEIIDMMDASNISRMHLGLDPLPYLWYKKTVQLGRADMMKFLDNEKSRIVLDYLSATRKQRREIPMFHKCYMTILSILRVKLKNENLDKEIKELNEKLEKLKKN
jgi:hypothetical protein